MYAMRGALTVIVKMGTGSPGAWRPGIEARLARSTTLPPESKASSSAGIPVDSHMATVTEETAFGKVARTGIGSAAIAHAIPLWPDDRCWKNITRPFALDCVGWC